MPTCTIASLARWAKHLDIKGWVSLRKNRPSASPLQYLRQYKPSHPWRVVVLYPSRNVEVEQPQQFEELLNCSRVQRIYLDELEVDE